jgi:hypothetical protein
VFSVCRLVSRRCHNISTLTNWGQPPPRTGRAPLTHPAPHGYIPATQDAAFCKRSGYHRESAAECGRCLVQLAITARPPSLHRHYPASFHRIGLPASAVLCSLPTSPPPFASLASSACRAYSSTLDKSSRDLTGCLANIVCNANGPSTPGLQQPLARARLPMLPST